MKRLLSELYTLTGKVNLYHYSKKDLGDDVILDPQETVKQRSSYSKNDYKTSSFPRVFYYTDYTKSEQIVRSKYLYTTQVDGDDILDLNDAAIQYQKDKEKLKLEEPKAFEVIDALLKPLPLNFAKTEFRPANDWTGMFKTAAKNYLGVYYITGNIPMVNVFRPLKVRRYDGV